MSNLSPRIFSEKERMLLAQLQHQDGRVGLTFRLDWEDHRAMTPLWMRHVTAAIAKHPKVGSLHIEGYAMNTACIDILASFLQEYQPLRVLELPLCSIGDDGARRLLSVISTRKRTMCRVNMIDLSFNFITSAGVQVIARKLETVSSSLRHISLRYNAIGAAGLGALLQFASGVSSLDVRFCGINPYVEEHGITCLERGFRENTVLELLRLDGNPWMVKAADELMPVIRANPRSRLVGDNHFVVSGEKEPAQLRAYLQTGGGVPRGGSDAADALAMEIRDVEMTIDHAMGTAGNTPRREASSTNLQAQNSDVSAAVSTQLFPPEPSSAASTQRANKAEAAAMGAAAPVAVTVDDEHPKLRRSASQQRRHAALEQPSMQVRVATSMEPSTPIFPHSGGDDDAPQPNTSVPVAAVPTPTSISAEVTTPPRMTKSLPVEASSRHTTSSRPQHEPPKPVTEKEPVRRPSTGRRLSATTVANVKPKAATTTSGATDTATSKPKRQSATPEPLKTVTHPPPTVRTPVLSPQSHTDGAPPHPSSPSSKTAALASSTGAAWDGQMGGQGKNASYTSQEIRTAFAVCSVSDEQCVRIMGDVYFTKLPAGSGRSLVPPSLVDVNAVPSELNVMPLRSVPRIRGLAKVLCVMLNGPIMHGALDTSVLATMRRVPIMVPSSEASAYNLIRKEENAAARTLLKEAVLLKRESPRVDVLPGKNNGASSRPSSARKAAPAASLRARSAGTGLRSATPEKRPTNSQRALNTTPRQLPPPAAAAAAAAAAGRGGGRSNVAPKSRTRSSMR